MNENRPSTLLKDLRAERLPSPRMARAVREAAGVTQSRLAKELGVHRVTVARWEAGQRQPRGSTKAAYARLLQELREAADA